MRGAYGTGSVRDVLEEDAELAELARRVATMTGDTCIRDTIYVALRDAYADAVQYAAQEAAMAEWVDEAREAAREAYEAAVRPEAREAARRAYLDSIRSTVTRRSAGVHTGQPAGHRTAGGTQGLGTLGGARREACARAGRDAGSDGRGEGRPVMPATGPSL